MLRILLMIAEGNIGRLSRITLISVMEAVTGAVPFAALWFVLADIIDNRFTADKFWLYTCIICSGAAARMLFTFLSVMVGRRDGTLMIKDLRLRLGEHIRKLPLSYFNSRNMGELSHRVIEDVNRIEMIITMIFPEMVSTLAGSLIIAAILGAIDYRLALAAFITMPVSLYLLSMARRIMDKRGRALHRSSERLAGALVEFKNGIKFIKSFNNSSRKMNDLTDRMADFRDKSLKTEGTLSPVMVLSGISIDSGLVVLFITGAYLLNTAMLDPKIFLLFMVLSSRLFESIKAFTMNYAKVKYLEIAGNSIREILSESLPEGTGVPGVFENHNIEYRDISFSYNSINVLNGISSSLKENTMTAIVGPSGSGKTTLVTLLARFYDNYRGDILLGGTPVKSVDQEEVLRDISMVFQNVTLFRDTIYNNIKIGNPGASEEDVLAAAKKAHCHEFISSLPGGYQTMVGENGATLSGGEQQRISIARALLKNAPVVLLDEATASLDPENEILIQDAISELLKDKTVIVIAHRLKTVKHADKIIVLDSGEIADEGLHEELMRTGGLYHRLWMKQQESAVWEISN